MGFMSFDKVVNIPGPTLRELRRADSTENTPAGANEDDMIMCTVKAGKEYVETIEVDGIEWISVGKPPRDVKRARFMRLQPIPCRMATCRRHGT